jgi:hypothetical protein
MTGHRRDYKLWLDKKKNYITSCEILKYEDCYIELLQEVEVESKTELYKIEGENIRKHNCVNKRIAGRTHKEYAKENAVHIAEYQSKYAKKNAVKIKEQKANYQKENAVHIAEQKSNYQKENAVSIAKQSFKYRQENAVRISERASKPYTCECGSIGIVAKKARHCKSKKHLNYMSRVDAIVGTGMVDILPVL